MKVTGVFLICWSYDILDNVNDNEKYIINDVIIVYITNNYNIILKYLLYLLLIF